MVCGSNGLGAKGGQRVWWYVTLLAIVAAASLQAQTIIGTWQGSLPIPDQPRVVLKIEKFEDGSLRGVFFRIDQSANGIPFSSVSFVAPLLNVVAAVVDTAYKGRLSAGGESVSGTWTQGGQSYPLTLLHATAETLWRHGDAPPLAPMAASAAPAFEVATIKPSAPDAKGYSYQLRSRQFAAKNRTVADLIRFAYDVRSRQISGGPDWINEPKFDIAAEADTEGAPSEDQDRLMLKKLLADRFQLKVHVLQKVFPVYALTLAKRPLMLSRSDPSANTHGNIITREGADGQMLVQFVHNSMPEFLGVLMNFIEDRQIVDETGLTGSFDFTMTAPMTVVQGSDANERANFFLGAVQPLGFRLMPKKAPLDVIVIDYVEKPSAN